MFNIMKVTFPVLISVMFFSCTTRPSTREKDPTPIHATTSKIVDTNYVRTGFYYLTEGGDGIRKKCEADGEVYSLAKIPFVSVDNVSESEIKMEKIKDKVYPNLCLQFDEKGTTDLEEGSGNPLHPQIAVVIAGKLIYLVENRPGSKTTTGKVCIMIEGSGMGVSGLELEAMKRAVDNKR
jgi:hypothetical protein